MEKTSSNSALKPSISLCMIVKNEGKILARCLNNIKNHADEIIIVDTGSTDNTIEIAQNYTNKIYHFVWCNDFSAARNFSLSRATKEWILVLDADEMIDKPYLLKRFLSKANNNIYQFRKMNMDVDYDKLTDKKYLVRKIKEGIITFHEKLFRNFRGFKYQGPVHERIFDENDNFPKTSEIGLNIYHFSDITKLKYKKEYYNQLGMKAIEKGDMNCNLIINLLIYFARKDDFSAFNNFLDKHHFFIEKRCYPSTLNLIKMLIKKEKFKEVEKIKKN